MTKMKKFILSLSSIVLFCCNGCVAPKSCEAYAQCDELYINDYNCESPQRNSYGVDRDYYPNTQTVYYYPRYVRVIQPTTQPIPHSEQKNITSKKRPSIVRPTHSSE